MSNRGRKWSIVGSNMIGSQNHITGTAGSWLIGKGDIFRRIVTERNHETAGTGNIPVQCSCSIIGFTTQVAILAGNGSTVLNFQLAATRCGVVIIRLPRSIIATLTPNRSRSCISSKVFPATAESAKTSKSEIWASQGASSGDVFSRSMFSF